MRYEHMTARELLRLDPETEVESALQKKLKEVIDSVATNINYISDESEDERERQNAIDRLCIISEEMV